MTPPISFTLVVDDFGMKYTNKADIDHLIECLKENYDLTQDWDGDLYCGIKLKWNYNEQILDISMPYKHDTPTKPQHYPYSLQPKLFHSEAHSDRFHRIHPPPYPRKT